MSEVSVLNYIIVALGSLGLFVAGRLGQHYQWFELRVTWVATEAGGLGIWILLCLTLVLRLAVWLMERAS